MPTVPICKHVKTNGQLCGCPALKGRLLCYFHDESVRRRRASARLSRKISQRQKALDLPVLEDANAVQVALMQTIDGLLGGRINERRTGLLLYALQTASSNLKHTTFSAQQKEIPEPWATELLDAIRALPEPEEKVRDLEDASFLSSNSRPTP